MTIEVLVRGTPPEKKTKYKAVCFNCRSILLWTYDDVESVYYYGSINEIVYTINCPVCEHRIRTTT